MFRRSFLNWSVLNWFLSNVKIIFKCWSNTEKAMVAVADSYSSMYVEATGWAISRKDLFWKKHFKLCLLRQDFGCNRSATRLCTRHATSITCIHSLKDVTKVKKIFFTWQKHLRHIKQINVLISFKKISNFIPFCYPCICWCYYFRWVVFVGVAMRRIGFARPVASLL